MAGLPVFAGGGSSGGGRIQIKIDDLDVMNTIEAVWNAVSGQSLEAFLDQSAHPYLTDQILNRFSHEGDSKSGNWPALTEATLNMKNSSESLAVDAEQINVRSGEFFDWVMHDADIHAGANEATLNLPGAAPNPVLATKLEHAQQGASGATNPLFDGDTPARPVLAVDESDLEGLLVRLAEHVIVQVGHGHGASSLSITSGRGQSRQSRSVQF